MSNFTLKHLCLVAVLCLAITHFQMNQAKPEYFADAIKFGANDCAFCHTTAAGGEAVNERGAWLISERDKKGALQVDVNWLTDRGEKSDENRQVELPSLEDTAPLIEPTKAIAVTEEHRREMNFTTQFGEWPSHNGGVRAQKYSPLSHINPDTIQDMKVAWIWEAEIDNGTLKSEAEAALQPPTSERRRWRRGGNSTGQPFKGTPLMVDGKVFVRTRVSSVAAIDAATGEQLWEFDPKTRLGPRPPMFGFTTRGLSYHKQSDCEEGSSCERIILLTSDGWLYALDTESGEPVASFGSEGRVDLTKGLRRPLSRSQASWSQPALVCNDVVVVGSQTDDVSQLRTLGQDWNKNLPVGDVRGFDPLTGEQLWVFKTIPQEGEFGVETWENESWRWMGNTNVWSTFSCDPELGHVYLPLTAPTDHMYGGHRPGNNLFATSVVALDISSGEREWHFQITHHDIWDYDLPAPPVVGTVPVNGELRKVVAQVTKVGYLFVLDRTNGKPVWPVIEREVPASKVEGEVAALTQPHPTKPPPFELQGMKDEYLNDLTPELKRRARELVKDIDMGSLYTPVSLNGAVLNPGIGGGANWPGASFNPDSGQLFVPSRRMPQIARLTPLDKERFGIPYRESWGFTNIDGLPLIRPPWSSYTAYDLGKGEIQWTVANGEGPKGHQLLKEVSTTLPDLGVVGAIPGILALPELLLVGHQPDRQQTFLRALDPSNGLELWRSRITGSFSNATPMSYSYGDKQYVVIGTGNFLEPSRLIAFAVDIPTE